MTKAILLILLFASVSCGGASTVDASRSALAGAARVLVEADRTLAPAYQRARVEAREASSSWAELDERLEPWEAARSSLHGAQSTLYAAEAALDSYEAGDDGAWFTAAACAAEALADLRKALRDVGLDPPPALSKLDAAFRSITRASCRPGG